MQTILFPYVGITQIRLWVKAIQLTLSLLDTQAPRFYAFFLPPSALCALLCLWLQIAQIDVKHLHPLHGRYQHRGKDRSAAA